MLESPRNGWDRHGIQRECTRVFARWMATSIHGPQGSSRSGPRVQWSGPGWKPCFNQENYALIAHLLLVERRAEKGDQICQFGWGDDGLQSLRHE